ncbi:hypothetical protein QBC47DRAFT_373212 [Echria macrotheca]|uniref:C2H2-type domain-containing protein n=1 Tax=Echria macrotheca TaxID=438768 RepID=A0AAJ0FE02_9PEZI|nr:hypothetical protein QBC47DRAFT_373212 [Echria macrotheca]
MSRPSQIPVADATVASPRWQPRPLSLRKSIAIAESTPRSPGQWVTGPSQRDISASRHDPLKKPKIGTDLSLRKPMTLRTAKLNPGSDRPIPNSEDDGKFSANISTGTAMHRSTRDDPLSATAVSDWRDGAQCLENGDIIASPQAFEEEPAEVSSHYEPRDDEGEWSSPKPLTRKSIARLSAVGVPEGVVAFRQDGGAAPQDPSPLLYPCPFRKRNPVRFNLRDHETCARAQFPSTAELRRHIITQHNRSSHHCPRCGVFFESQLILTKHLVVSKDEMCELDVSQMAGDLEDGISRQVEGVLTACPGESDSWGRIWKLLFPVDKEIPEPDFYPLVELAEVEQALDDGQSTLKNSLHEKIRMLLPETIDDSYCTFLTGQLELVFETHVANTMRQCLGRVESTTDFTRTSEPRGLPENRDTRARRNTRRSRRSTMLQSIRFPDTADFFPETHRRASSPQQRPKQRDSFRTHSNHSQEHDQALSRTEPVEVSSTTPSPSPLRLVSHNTLRILPQSTARIHQSTRVCASPDLEDCSASRDSRDSGIGLLCDACGSEICQCHDGISQNENAVDARLKHRGNRTTPPPPPPKNTTVPGATTPPHSPARITSQQLGVVSASTYQNYSMPTAAKSQPSLRHQPRLRVNTRDMNNTSPAMGFWSSSTAARGEGFSPQSFKQRMLRTQQDQLAHTWTPETA